MANVPKDPSEKFGIPPVMAAEAELAAAREAVVQATKHLEGAMSLGIAGAGGEHAPKARELLMSGLVEIDKAIRFHSGG